MKPALKILKSFMYRLVPTNYPRSFQRSNVFETGLSDFHKLTITVLKQYIPKQKPMVMIYRNYQNFQDEIFRAELDNEILKCDLNNIAYQHFLNLLTEVLGKHAPLNILLILSKN